MNNNLGIKDLAKLAQVSIGTVDRVLHNRIGVSPATKEKVLKIVEETGYKKNMMASRLKLASIKVIKIAVLVPDGAKESSYWNLPVSGVESAAEELRELGVTTQFFYFELLNPSTFSDIINSIIEERFDGLVTVPFFAKESNVLLEKAKAKNLPVVFIDAERHLNLPANYIKQNSINAGLVAARLLHGLCGDSADYIVVNIINKRGKQINNLQREVGFRTYFAENLKQKKISINAIDHPMINRLDLSQEIRDLLNNDKPKGIFVTNSRAFIIPKLLKEYNIKHAKLVGFDLNPKNIAFLESGDIDFLINQKPEFQGYSAIKGLYKYLTEQDNSMLNLEIPIEIVVKENLSSFHQSKLDI